MGDTHSHRFELLSGYFVDYPEIAKTYPRELVLTQPKLGLIDRVYDNEKHAGCSGQSQWARFEQHVRHLNETSPEGTSYKVLYVVRHGTGVHNVAMDQLYRDKQKWEAEGKTWKDYWSHLDGDADGDIGVGKGVVWADAELVESGMTQAETLSRLLSRNAQEGMPLPATLYTSPLRRCLKTTKIVYSQVLKEHGQDFKPIVKEKLRERLTDHTCDRRSSRTWIAKNYPEYPLEGNFTEDDELWPVHRNPPEDLAQHTKRKTELLNDIFSHDPSTFISLSTHSYALTAILYSLGCTAETKFRVNEGVMVALFVKAVRAETEVARPWWESLIETTMSFVSAAFSTKAKSTVV